MAIRIGAGAQTPLEIYDAAITADGEAGLVPAATLTAAVTLTGTGGANFDFGVISDDATIEFIVEGNPAANDSSYLAVGSTTASSLRYEVWSNTGQLGFTQARVADYQFTPGVPTPVEPAHVAYVWDPATTTMKVYVNGTLAGTTTGVDAAFVMPSGAGRLGANESGEEGMVGTIHRVTVYDSIVSESTLKRHASAFGAHVGKALTAYDAAVATDAAGGLTPVSKLGATVVLNGIGGAEFDFGFTSDDATLEFILEGDPSANNTAFLAVGENSGSSLRYELWDNTGQLGFTQAGVADYPFVPGVPSPTQPSHVAYQWDSAALTMKLYLNGQLAGTASNISGNFAMPTGLGRLGNNPGGTEPMVGTVYRVTVYDELLSDAAILKHAKSFTDVLRPPIIVGFAATPASLSMGGSSTLTWEVQNATKVLINGIDRTGVDRLEVTPEVSTTYTLTAENAFGRASTQVRVQVNPALDAYDAAIGADAAAGLVPLGRLTVPATFTGSGGVPFDFGAGEGDGTLEIIVEGDPSANVGCYLAVGENTTSNLRYEAWNNTGQVGFTQLGVADYLFSPPVPSSTWPTHLAYVWDAASLTMSLYVNGSLAGTTAEVNEGFGLPRGLGWLGSNPTGGESLVGTIYRVTAYAGQTPAATIRRHADAFLSAARPALRAYDQAIEASANSGLTPASRLYAPVSLTGVGGVSFGFGTTSGDATMEFVLEGDPGANVSAFLAVGTNPSSSLRYEVWNDTGELGFTQGGVADYQFTPGVPSPRRATHVAYVWDAPNLVMKAYVDGIPAGTTSGVSPDFAMPVDLGVLGNNAGGSEPMVGTIHRVTVYDSLLSDDVILAHARGFTGNTQPPALSVKVTGVAAEITLTQGVSGAHYRVEYRASLGSAETWKVLQDIPSLSGTTAKVADPTPITGQGERYYRAVLIP